MSASCNHDMPCGCCEGTQALTPLPLANRPGLPALTYRVGTHATFLETMTARLSSHYLESAERGAQADSSAQRPLAALTTRDPADPSIALLDAWATVGDVLTFHQERIANEGYLRTATERRSVLELARLVGYRLRPGVAASVYLAYTIDDHTKEQVPILKGARVQSVPGPEELPQTFETGEDLVARAAWNRLTPRQTKPQQLPRMLALGRLYLRGISTNLKPNDPLLIGSGLPGSTPALFRVISVETQPQAERTKVEIRAWNDLAKEPPAPPDPKPFEERLGTLIKASSRPLANGLQLPRRLTAAFKATSDAGLQLLSAVRPEVRLTLPAAVAGYSRASLPPQVEVHALRQKAGLFGHNFPKRQRTVRTRARDNRASVEATEMQVIGEWPMVLGVDDNWRVTTATESDTVVYLDGSYERLLPDSWMVVDFGSVPVFPDRQVFVEPHAFPEDDDVKIRDRFSRILVVRARTVQAKISRAEYGASGDTTRVIVDRPWLRFVTTSDNGSTPTRKMEDQAVIDRNFQVVRSTAVYAESERLELADEPLEEPVCGGAKPEETIELNALYHGLEPGRFLIVSGERTDIADTPGVAGTEAVMIAEVVHDVRRSDRAVPLGQESSERALPGDKNHTFLRLDKPLAYCYRRDTLTLYANVVKATHGETRNETLGGGDGAKALQAFALKQPPLTYLAAPTAVGTESTLQVFVDDVRWRETDTFIGLSPIDHRFIVKTEDDGQTTVVFGNGRTGARLPTGIENVKATYRSGIGKGGNVRAGQISLLSSRPLGVREVINPLRASGGADRESRDQARKNAPLAVKALDRLVSTRDYQDFARCFAGIGKAYATELSDGRRRVVHVTIAGAEDIPIDKGSDLFRNLRQALSDLGDPLQPVELALRELVLLVVSANVRILPDHQWEPVITAVRATLLGAFGFERRELGEDAWSSEILSAIQSVRGVAYVDLDAFGGIPATIPDAAAEDGRRPLTPAEIAERIERIADAGVANRVVAALAEPDETGIRPAQIALLTPDVAATLILNQIR